MLALNFPINLLYYYYFKFRWRSNLMFLMTKCVTSAMGYSVVESMLPSSAEMSIASSTTVSTVGQLSTRCQANTVIDHWSRKDSNGREQWLTKGKAINFLKSNQIAEICQCHLFNLHHFCISYLSLYKKPRKTFHIFNWSIYIVKCIVPCVFG